MYNLEHVDDHDLLRGARRAVRANNRATALLLAHLAEMDTRRVYLAQAKPSLFQYAVDVLGLSEGAAYTRITVARTARAYPVLFELVASGALHLAAVRLVTPHLTEENHAELLDAVSCKSKRAVQHELARRFPRPEAPTVLRKLPTPRRGEVAQGVVTQAVVKGGMAVGGTAEPVCTPGPALPGAARGELPLLLAPAMSGTARGELPLSLAAPQRPVPPGNTEPLSESRYKLQVTLSRGTHTKLRAAQDLLRHQVPSGDLAEVLNLALDALLERCMKRKVGRAGGRPQGSRTRSRVRGNRPRRSAVKWSKLRWRRVRRGGVRRGEATCGR